VRLIAGSTKRLILRESSLPPYQPDFHWDLQHTCSNLSERLNLSHDEGEKWIVNLIRETRMGADAKIDLEKVCPFSYGRHPTIQLAYFNFAERH
jgi:hypothetical protein